MRNPFYHITYTKGIDGGDEKAIILNQTTTP